MQQTQPVRARTIVNKVPEVTACFWVVTVLAATVGGTAADLLSTRLRLGLTNTTWLMAFLLAVALLFQLASRRYVPGIYWITVALTSIAGTLITDIAVDHDNVSLGTTTILLAGAVAATLAIWYAQERTLSIHAIDSTRREAFYWLAILFTFALGAAAADLIAESLNVGYWKAALLLAASIGVVAIVYRLFRSARVLACRAPSRRSRDMGDPASPARRAGSQLRRHHRRPGRRAGRSG
jgi:uncharacterized membrane-anchored protein